MCRPGLDGLRYICTSRNELVEIIERPVQDGGTLAVVQDEAVPVLVSFVLVAFAAERNNGRLTTAPTSLHGLSSHVG